MNPKATLGILAACVSGFLGGTLASQTRVQASSVDVVRASRFELVNPAGSTVADWEVTPSNEVRLRFASSRGNAVEIGVLEDGRPYLRMRGRDDKNRIVMELDQRDKPLLGMGDEKWEGRLRIGFVEPDVVDPNSDDWGISLCPFGTTRPIVGMRMAKTAAGEVEGRLMISGRSIH